MKQKYIFMDIDNTLLDHEIGVPQSALDAIHKAKTNGHKVFICTGRASSEMEPSLVNIDFDGYVYSCGANVQISDTCIAHHPMPQKDILYILKQFANIRVAFNLEGGNDSFLNESGWNAFFNLIRKDFNSDQEATQYMESIHMHPLNAMSDADIEQIVKICVFSYEDAFLNDIIPNLPAHLTYTQHSMGEKALFGEITQKRISKATGIDCVIQHFNANIEDTICFGDSMNDYAMIEHCHIGVCVGNGEQNIKDIADYVCEDIRKDGIYLAFQHLGLI